MKSFLKVLKYSKFDLHGFEWQQSLNKKNPPSFQYSFLQLLPLKTL